MQASEPARTGQPSWPARPLDDAGLLDRLQGQASRAETAFDAADGAGRLVWHRWGDGEPVVLLHGGAGSWRHWVRNIDALLCGGHSVLAPDLPGLGESSMPPLPYHPARVAGIVAAGLRALRLAAPCALVGFSFGAVVAGQLAAEHPLLVRSLVLVGAGALGVQRAPIALAPVRGTAGGDRAAALRTNLLQLMIAEPDHVDALALAVQDWNVAHARVNSVGFASSTALLDALGEVRCPFGAIWGEYDHPAGALLHERIAAVRRLRPGLPVEVIPQAGHWVAFEAAAAFDAALARMLVSLHA